MNRDDRTPPNPLPVPVAIIGMGCLFPGAGDLGRYWANIRDGVDAIREVPPTHWNPDDYHDADPKAPDRTYARRGGFLDPVDFPALDFGIAPANLDATDTTQLLGLMVAKAALDDAGYGAGGRAVDRERVSVLLGVTGTLELVIPLGARLGHPIWRRALKDAGVAEPVASEVVRRIADSYVGWQENSFPGLLGNVAAGRIANRLDLGGTNCVVDAACASSLGAVHLATMELAAGRCDVALTGGLDTFNDIFMYMCFSKTPALSPTGDARPFSAAGDGTTLGEGLGVLTLKRLDDARRDGDRIYAVIKGVGSSSDGKGNAVYAPSAAGQARCLRRAYESSGVAPDTVELVEAHGTGTKVGDAVELAALAEVYRSSKAEGTWCALGSVKSQIGHTKAAAGAAGLIKAALALHHKVLPPTIKVDRPAEGAAPGSTPFYLNTEPRPWLPSPGHPRRAAVSAFGFGGSNFHCVLEEADPEPAAVAWDGDVQIFALSGPDPGSIRRALAAIPEGADWDALRLEAARSRAAFRTDAPCRLLVVADRAGVGWPKLVDRARSLLDGPAPSPLASSPEAVYYAAGADPGKLAVLFPGQGSQHVGMLRGLACRFPAMLHALAGAGSVDGRTIGDWIYPHPSFDDGSRAEAERSLRATEVAQPALGAVSLGAYRLLEGFGLRPDAVAGHSFGELTALCASGRIDERDFFDLARARGRLMAEAGPGDDRGAMLAVMAPLDTVEAALRDEGLDLVVANRNAPRQSILSGPTVEVARAVEVFAARGIATRTLDVAAAFHSRFVAGAASGLLEALGGVAIAPPAIPSYANSTAGLHPDDPDEARATLAGQLARPVRFVEMVEAMARDGVSTFLEVGPDGKLSGLVDAIFDGQARRPVAIPLDPSKGKRGHLVDLARALAQLAAIGHSIRLDAWDEGFEARSTATRKPGLTVKVSGANFAPKPPPSPAPALPIVPPSQALHATPSPEPPTPMTPKPAARPAIASSPAPEPRRNGQAPAPRPMPAQAPAPRVAAAPAPIPVPSSYLVEALRASQENLVALQRIGEQTAHLHRQFLEGQDRAQQTFHSLLEHQQRLTLAAIGQAPRRRPSRRRAAEPRGRRPADPRPRGPTPRSPGPTSRDRREAGGPAGGSASPGTGTGTGTGLRGTADRGDGRAGRVAGFGRPCGLGGGGLGEDGLPGGGPGAGHAARRRPGDRLDQAGRDPGGLAGAAARGAGDRPGAPRHHPDPRTDRGIPGRRGGRGRRHAVDRGGRARPEPGGRGPRGVGGGGLGEDRLPGGGPRAGHAARRRPGDRLDQAGRDPGGLAGAAARGAGDRPGAPRHHPDPRADRRIPRGRDGDGPPLGPGRAAPTAAPSVADEPVRRLVPTAVALGGADRREAVRLPGDAEVWILDDGSPLVDALVEGLGRAGSRARKVAMGLSGGPAAPDRLAGLIVPSGVPVLDAFRLLRRVAGPLRLAGGSFATLTRLGGSFGLGGLPEGVDPASGALAGLSKTAGLEWPEVHCKAIDLDPSLPTGRLASAVIDELTLRGPAEVGVRESGRSTVALAPAAIGPGRAVDPLSKGDLVIVTGGARGVTAEVALALAGAFRPTLAILGRSPSPVDEPGWLAPLRDEAEIKRSLHARAAGRSTPQSIGEQFREVAGNREVVANLGRIGAAGATVVYRPVDVRDREAVREAVASLRAEHGPVRGIVHGAGVLADRKIEDQTDEQFARVFDTKVAGLDALLEAAGSDDLKALILFSSSTARFGRAGQVAYAAANEALNKLAGREAQARPGCRVLAVNWGPWAGGMVTPSLAPVFLAEGIPLIPMAGGASYLVDELRGGDQGEARPVEVVILGGGGPEPAFLAPKAGPVAAPAEELTEGLAKVFERPLDVESTPILGSHVMDGRPVLPMALILEWLAQGAMTRNPGMSCLGVDDLRLLKGVVVREALPETIRALAGKGVRRDGLTVVPVELRGVLADGREVLHARGEVVLGDRYPQAPAALDEPELPPYGSTALEIYRDVLFHGPDLQGIVAVEGCGDGGIVASVAAAPAPSEWVVHPLRNQWLTDPLALDGAFQMMILWSIERAGSGSLPTFVGRYRQFRRAFPPEGVRVVARVTEAGPHRARADVDFLDARGVPVARIEDYECVIDASLRAAFRRNRAVQVEAK